MAGLIAYLVANKAMILAILFFLSEALAQIPSIKANSIFQLVHSLLKKQAPPVEA